MLRALGASSRQVLTEVIGESFVVGLLASAVGVVDRDRSRDRAEGADERGRIRPAGQGVTVTPRAIVVGLVVGTVITVLSSIVPARQAARVPPIAAMRDVALERPPNRVLRLIFGGGAMLLGIVVMFVGLFAGVDNAIVVRRGRRGARSSSARSCSVRCSPSR